ncbi:MAG: hypothetical protein K2P63_16250, partial [Lachnospiraceae bacterium]|nr:hypothetical protein [Lachnospiraceae bacterium]
EWGDEEKTEMKFDPEAWQDEAFPVRRFNNIEYLIQHVQEQFYCADPIAYHEVLRRIRVSKNAKADKAYAIGMYTNSSNTRICQICKKPISFIEVPQIANFGIEMPQLNLCLCLECAAKYRAVRDSNKDAFKKQIKTAIFSIDAQEYLEEYSIELHEDMVLNFTQMHIAEIQVILHLLDEYGIPSESVGNAYEDNVSKPFMHLV